MSIGRASRRHKRPDVCPNAVARQSGLAAAIDRHVELLQSHFPYHESDHVLNIAFNAMTDGTCLEDLKKKRADEAYLNALGAKRIPDASTAGDFCRRFESKADIDCLHTAIDEARRNVWSQQPDEFIDCATVDMDSSIVETTGECKPNQPPSHQAKNVPLEQMPTRTQKTQTPDKYLSTDRGYEFVNGIAFNP